MNVIAELSWRGMVQDIMPGTEAQLEKEMTKAYVGFDPTADSLHVGSLIPILLLLHLQRAGHQPIALVGGATGMVGDPSGKSKERNLLDESTLKKNQAGVEAQLRKFLDFSPDLDNPALVVNNYDWFSNMGFLEFIRDVGKHITVNYMMAKDSVKKRMDSGMSYTEFSYQLVQGYDFYHLFTSMGVKLQMGGSDQWGNIVTGTELIRRKGGEGAEAFAFTCPLMTKADGGKFGKSEAGNIWLDKERTSVYKFYQFWLNTADEDLEKYLKTFTFLDQQEIEILMKEHAGNEHLRVPQKRLAEEITRFVHGKDELDLAQEASAILFSNSTEEALKSLKASQLEDIFEGVPQSELRASDLDTGLAILDVLADSGMFSSKGEARRALKSNAISVNKTKVPESYALGSQDVIDEKYILLQNGKKKYHLVKVNP